MNTHEIRDFAKILDLSVCVGHEIAFINIFDSNLNLVAFEASFELNPYYKVDAFGTLLFLLGVSGTLYAASTNR